MRGSCITPRATPCLPAATGGWPTPGAVVDVSGDGDERASGGLSVHDAELLLQSVHAQAQRDTEMLVSWAGKHAAGRLQRMAPARGRSLFRSQACAL